MSGELAQLELTKAALASQADTNGDVRIHQRVVTAVITDQSNRLFVLLSFITQKPQGRTVCVVTEYQQQMILTVQCTIVLYQKLINFSGAGHLVAEDGIASQADGRQNRAIEVEPEDEITGQQLSQHLHRTVGADQQLP